MRQVVLLEPEQELRIPDNCWGILEHENGKRELVTGTIKVSQRSKLVLIPKIAGG